MYPVSNHSGNGASGVCPCVRQRVYNRVDSKVAGIATLRRNTANRSADFVYRGEGNMCVYRQGEISHSLAASEGPIHVITRIVCQLERAYIFSALEKKSRVCLVNKRRKTKEI